jgi:hypothetical protein
MIYSDKFNSLSCRRVSASGGRPCGEFNDESNTVIEIG